MLVRTPVRSTHLNGTTLLIFDREFKEDKNMEAFRNAVRNFGVVRELLYFFGSRRWWLAPIVATLFLLGVLIVLAESSAIAPFIYSLF